MLVTCANCGSRVNLPKGYLFDCPNCRADYAYAYAAVGFRDALERIANEPEVPEGCPIPRGTAAQVLALRRMFRGRLDGR